ncbi:MAG TPA: type II toxin-antitoxin system Phd/YefM family antitoxin [Candidatus Paceibacterota bacterium]|nr:type II toxin-antitoxin system Phd/YefM family antitoxin [Candidatus Paceibacterota bacterium]
MSHTKQFAAREAKNRFGELLDSAQRSPVRITKNGRQVAVLLSSEEYRRYEMLEDAAWAKRASAAEREGFLGTEESEALLKQLRNAED